ncbi:MAG: hypothetical protein ABIO70_34895 [Pseudomonadota bacterium]
MHRLAPLLTLISLSSLAACAADWQDAPEGFASACLSGDIPEDLYEQGGASFTIDGTVIAEGEDTLPPEDLMECYGQRDRVLTLEDGDAGTWHVAFGITDPDDAMATPAMDVVVGQEVHLLYRTVASFGTAQGFVLTDDDGLVAALESGTWGPALQDGDVPGLSVSDGEMMGTLESECGTEGHFAWSFAGDETVEVQPYGSGTVPIDGIDHLALAVANMQWQGDVLCTDLAGDQMWAVFR